MKTYKHIMETFLTHENYMLAVKNATEHKSSKKRKYRTAKKYKENPEKYESKILDYAKHFHNAEHKPVLIYDGIRRKQRTIIVPTMEEQIVHHMIVNVLKPIFFQGMYEHSYGSIPDRGGHKAKKTIEKWIHRKDRNMKYCLKMDIKKFFDSVPHDILVDHLSIIIKDEEFMNLMKEVVSVTETGIPLGFYTSQWIANWYLQGLDHFIKEDLKAKYYVRYMDDMVIFGSNKRELHRMRSEIEQYLNDKLGLKLKENWQVFLFDYVDSEGKHRGRFLDFMGFQFYRDRTCLRKSIMLKATRKAKRIRKKPVRTIYDARQMLSYLGWIDCTDTYNMYKKRIKPHVSFRRLKKQVSRHQRAENRRLQCGEKRKIATQTNR